MKAAQTSDLIGSLGMVFVAACLLSCGATASGEGSLVAPPEQAQALSDGDVTFAEYDTAFRSMVECVRGQGFEIERPIPDEFDPQLYVYETTADEGEQARLTDEAVEVCNAKYLTFVAQGWADANYDPNGEDNDRLYEMTIACLQEGTGDDLSGYDASSPSDLDVLLDTYAEQYDACQEEAIQVLRDEP